jgi:hypothetical protein
MLNLNLMREIENRLVHALKRNPMEFQSAFHLHAWMQTHLTHEDAEYIRAALEGHSNEDAVERWMLDIVLKHGGGIAKATSLN